MRTLATDTTADQLLDYLASDGTGGKWTYYAEMSDWESAYNLWRERHFVGWLAPAIFPAYCQGHRCPVIR